MCLAIPVVAHDEPIIFVEDHEAFRNAVDGVMEQRRRYDGNRAFAAAAGGSHRSKGTLERSSNRLAGSRSQAAARVNSSPISHMISYFG
jgi:hypothetical protein